ncbi:MAG: hypothetical protein ACI9JN_002585, partial [Bacteroidia bacterium]
MIKKVLFFVFILVAHLAYGQVDVVRIANKAVDGNQIRIDKYDGKLNDSLQLVSPMQTNQATDLYFRTVDAVQKNINNNNNYTELDKKRRLNDLVHMLEKVDRSNYHLYTTFQSYFQLIIRIQEVIETNRIKAILKSDLKTTLHVIPFFDDKPYASDILQLASKQYPSEVLKHYGDFAFQSYAGDVLEMLCQTAPAHVSFYMGTPNPVFTDMYNIKGQPTIDKMMEIFRKVGSNSKAYIFLDDISNYTLTTNEAHQLGRSKALTFTHLLDIRTKPNILGGYSVDDELTYLATRKVREINELHEERDNIRFQLCDTSNMSAQELYTLMVYGEDEVYTSTFLGLFKRLMTRMAEKSSYEFLHNLGRNKYRTFIKMCAAYNELPTFLNKMSLWEKRALFNSFISGLESEINPLEQAVAVADTYGSITNEDTKSLFELALKKEYAQVKWKNPEAEKLYGLLLELLQINPESESLSTDLAGLSTVSNQSMIKGGEHVQQHFFFDDADGWAS